MWGGIAQAGAQLLGGSAAAQAQAGANRQSSYWAQQNLRWQQLYSKNKHRYMVEDLRNAGLNPMLAAGMSPGSAGGGSQPTFIPETAEAEGIQQAAHSALEVKKAKQELKLLEEQTENIKSTTKKTKTEEHLLDKQKKREGVKEKLWGDTLYMLNSAEDIRRQQNVKENPYKGSRAEKDKARWRARQKKK